MTFFCLKTNENTIAFRCDDSFHFDYRHICDISSKATIHFKKVAEIYIATTIKQLIFFTHEFSKEKNEERKRKKFNFTSRMSESRTEYFNETQTQNVMQASYPSRR